MQNTDTRLVKKLGIEPGCRLLILNAPAEYRVLLGKLPENVVSFETLQKDLDIVQYFVEDREKLTELFPKLALSIKDTGAVWISWIKSTSTKESNLNENTVREIGLSNDMVDTKIVSINETWSGLKFVYRLADRA